MSHVAYYIAYTNSYKLYNFSGAHKCPQTNGRVANDNGRQFGGFKWLLLLHLKWRAFEWCNRFVCVYGCMCVTYLWHLYMGGPVVILWLFVFVFEEFKVIEKQIFWTPLVRKLWRYDVGSFTSRLRNFQYAFNDRLFFEIRRTKQ